MNMYSELGIVANIKDVKRQTLTDVHEFGIGMKKQVMNKFSHAQVTDIWGPHGNRNFSSNQVAVT